MELNFEAYGEISAVSRPTKWQRKTMPFKNIAVCAAWTHSLPRPVICRIDRGDFPRFLGLNRYGDKQIDLILDHTQIHHAQIMHAFLADHPELHLMFSPSYSPKLIHVERVGSSRQLSLRTCSSFAGSRCPSRETSAILFTVNKA